MDRRRLLILQRKQEELPDGYTQLEYLQSDGTQWINTEYILQSSDTVELKAEYIQKGSLNYTTAYLCGSDTFYNEGFNISEDISTSQGIREVFGTELNITGLSPKIGVEFLIRSSVRELEIIIGYEIKVWTKSQNYTPLDFPVYLFTTNRNGTAFDAGFIGKIYYAKITNSQGEMTLNCIPCLDANGIPCLYDLVSKTPLYNQGTGSFTWG